MDKVRKTAALAALTLAALLCTALYAGLQGRPRTGDISGGNTESAASAQMKWPAESLAEETVRDDVLETAEIKDPHTGHAVRVLRFRGDASGDPSVSSKDGVSVSYLIKEGKEPEREVYMALSDYLERTEGPAECTLSRGTFLEGNYTVALMDSGVGEPVEILFSAKRTGPESCLVTRIVLSEGYEPETAELFLNASRIERPVQPAGNAEVLV